MFFDDHRKHGLRHNPFKALVAPRPIAWMSSVGTDGVANLVPFSYFNACADRPPIVMFAPNNPARTATARTPCATSSRPTSSWSTWPDTISAKR